MAVAEKVSKIDIYPCMIHEINYDEDYAEWYKPNRPTKGTVYFYTMLDIGHYQRRKIGLNMFIDIEDLSPGKLFYTCSKIGPGYQEFAVRDEGCETDEMYKDEFYNEYESLKEQRTNYLRETHLDELLNDES